MTVTGTVGERLSAAIKKAKVSNQQVAETARVHIKTVSAWRNDKQVPSDAALMALEPLLKVSGKWIRSGDQRPPEWAVGYEGFAPTISVAPADPFSAKHRAFVHRFVAEIVEAGATEAQAESARKILLNPANYALGSNGDITFGDDERMLRDLERLALSVRSILIARGVPLVAEATDQPAGYAAARKALLQEVAKQERAAEETARSTEQDRKQA